MTKEEGCSFELVEQLSIKFLESLNHSKSINNADKVYYNHLKKMLKQLLNIVQNLKLDDECHK